MGPVRQNPILLSKSRSGIINLRLLTCPSTCLQCFDTAGWAAGRASGL